MNQKLSARELSDLVTRVFSPTETDTRLAFLVDLPDEALPDHAEWRERRRMTRDWIVALREAGDLTMDVELLLYRNVRANNADLPAFGWSWDPRSPLPASADEAESQPGTPLDQLLGRCQLIIAPTELSTTAPLKVLAPKLGLRAATMPGFRPEMVPALRLDYREVNRQVHALKEFLDQSVRAEFVFEVTGQGAHQLTLDLRHRTSHASGGLLPKIGTAGNLPSGEAYIVPYEGELAGDASRSEGTLPVQLDGEVVIYRIAGNKAVEVLSEGPVSDSESRLIHNEPAYANLSELGLGVLGGFGVKPVGEVLLDEKLGLHIAFGRSDHFGGQVGPDDFSSPLAVTHQDRVYIPELQPDVNPASVDLVFEDGRTMALMKDGLYVIDF